MNISAASVTQVESVTSFSIEKNSRDRFTISLSGIQTCGTIKIMMNKRELSEFVQLLEASLQLIGGGE